MTEITIVMYLYVYVLELISSRTENVMIILTLNKCYFYYYDIVIKYTNSEISK